MIWDVLLLSWTDYSINSAIDCFTTRYIQPYEMNGEDTLWCKLINCHFEDSFRNSVSLVSGNNIDFINCSLAGGGFVHDGTNPRYTLDIEPTTGDPDKHARNIKFTNCNFSRAINVVLGGTWGQALFSGCTIDASYKHPVNVGKVGYPWAFSLSSIGDWVLNGCKVIGSKADKSTICVHYNAYDTVSDFSENGGLKINDTNFEYCGFDANGRKLSLNNVNFKNSLRLFLVRKGNEIPRGDLLIRNLKLINVFDGTNFGSTPSSFVINNYHKGSIDIDGLQLIVDKALLEKEFVAGDFSRPGYRGAYISAGMSYCASNGYLAVAKNIYIEGYYKRINDAMGVSLVNRDWDSPNLPPADTFNVVSSVTGTASGTTVTGTATQTDVPANRVYGNRTTAIYQNCAMWGDYA